MQNRFTVVLGAGFALLLLFSWLAVSTLFMPRSSDRFAQCRASVIAGGSEQIGGAFTLVNQHGQSMSQDDVSKTPALLYFGYTFCPDICPMDTMRNVEAVDLLETAGQNVTPVFITIDPERDTPLRIRFVFFSQCLQCFLYTYRTLVSSISSLRLNNHIFLDTVFHLYKIHQHKYICIMCKI